VKEAAPIFVAGLDHSGKTALRAALGAHPAIHMVRHIELWTRLRAWHATGAGGRKRVLDALTTGRAERLGLDRERLDRSASGDFADLVCEVGRQLCERAGKSRWGLQEALLEFEAEHVLREMPGAKIIGLVRDPRDRFQRMRLSGAVGRGGLAAETAAWIASVRAALAAAELRPDHFRVIRYESLIDRREPTLREVCTFIGEPFVDAMADGEPAGRDAGALPERDVAFIQRRAAPEIMALGYEMLTIATRTDMLPQRLADASRWQLGRLSWRRRSSHLHPSVASKRG
jgi:Sulfotransferase family